MAELLLTGCTCSSNMTVVRAPLAVLQLLAPRAASWPAVHKGLAAESLSSHACRFSTTACAWMTKSALPRKWASASTPAAASSRRARAKVRRCWLKRTALAIAPASADYLIRPVHLRAGGYVPDHVAEEEDAVLQDVARLLSAYHDSSRYSMLRLNLAPVTPFSCTDAFFVKCAQLAQQTPGMRKALMAAAGAVCRLPVLCCMPSDTSHPLCASAVRPGPAHAPGRGAGGPWIDGRQVGLRAGGVCEAHGLGLPRRLVCALCAADGAGA